LSEVTPECPDRYLLRGERGRGGQARVLLAHDRHIGRPVAWKELLPGLDPGNAGTGTGTGASKAAPALAVARFLREARVTGQLEHPGIVPVHELGQRADGRLYYTMRLVRGRTLAAAVEASPALPDRLKLLNHFVDLCHAVAYAHSRGVIHRDIKPDNVMVGPFGETVLLDWGLARLRGQDEPEGAPAPRSAAGHRPGADSGNMKVVERPGSAHTLDGATLGTPAYMSPEQAQGQLARIDERSDVWSLGAVLYEILTGQPPFTGSSPMAVAAKVCLERPVHVLSRSPKAPPELAAVVHKALSAEQDDRYPTAGALADDITAHMTGGRVGAFNYSRGALLRRFARRHRAAFTAGGLALSAIVVALIFTVLAWRDESAARQEEVQARGREHTEQLRAHGHLAQALALRAETLAEARATLSSRIYAAASLVHNPAEPGSPHHDADFAASAPELQPWRVRADSLLRQSAHRTVQGLVHRWQHDEVVAQVAFSPDGRNLAGVDYGGWLTLRESRVGRDHPARARQRPAPWPTWPSAPTAPAWSPADGTAWCGCGCPARPCPAAPCACPACPSRRWRSRPTAAPWRWPAKRIRWCRCGTSKPARCAIASTPTAAAWWAWPGRPTAPAWPRAAGTKKSTCTTWPPATHGWRSRDTPRRCIGCISRPMAPAW
jgi:serine/threonine protein kinase